MYNEARPDFSSHNRIIDCLITGLLCFLLSGVIATLSACDDEGGSGRDSEDTAGTPAGEEMDEAGTPFVPNPDGYLTRTLIDDQASGPAFAAIKDMNGDGKI